MFMSRLTGRTLWQINMMLGNVRRRPSYGTAMLRLTLDPTRHQKLHWVMSRMTSLQSHPLPFQKNARIHRPRERQNECVGAFNLRSTN